MGFFEFPNPSGGTWHKTVEKKKPKKKHTEIMSEVVLLDEVKEPGFSVTLERLSIKTVYNEEAMNVLLRHGWTIRQAP
jgi:hypothetical protein